MVHPATEMFNHLSDNWQAIWHKPRTVLPENPLGPLVSHRRGQLQSQVHRFRAELVVIVVFGIRPTISIAHFIASHFNVIFA